MKPPRRLRPLSEEEGRVIKELARSQTASIRLVQRARIIELASQGKTIPQIIAQVGCAPNVVRKWFKRFSEQGLAGLEDAPRSGAPSRYTAENKALVIATARTRPSEWGLSYGRWTFERLAAYLQEQHGVQMKKTRIFELLRAAGLRWRQQETGFGERLAPAFAERLQRSAPPLPPAASS
jgi:transposase